MTASGIALAKGANASTSGTTRGGCAAFGIRRRTRASRRNTCSTCTTRRGSGSRSSTASRQGRTGTRSVNSRVGSAHKGGGFMLSKKTVCLFLFSLIQYSAACDGHMTPTGSVTTTDGGGTGTNVSAGNVAACQSYVQTFNSLSCVAVSTRLDPVAVCPSTLNANGCNAVPYFDCVKSVLRCKIVAGISVIDTSGVQNCANLYPCH